MFRKLLSAVTGAIVAISFPVAGLAAEQYEILQVGDEDAWVMELQTKLNETGYLKVPATGYYGTNTQNAVISYQRDHGLSVDGKAGPITRKDILGEEYRPITGPRTPGQDSILVSPGAPATATGMIADPGNTEPEESSADTQSEPEISVQSNDAPAENENTAHEQDSSKDGTSLKLGDKGETISNLQKTLREYDYYDYGSITGYFGPVTKDAVVRFQHTYGLTEDGIVGPEAQQILNSGNLKYYTLKEGDRGDDVSKLQNRLKELGYMSGTATGYYGDITKGAIEKFQAKNGLAVDGTAGRETRGVLFSDNAVSAPAADEAEPSESETPSLSQEETTATQTPDAEEPESVEPAETAEPAASEKPQDEEEPSDKPAEPVKGSLDKFISIAESKVGKPYVYGAVGPNSFDCSGFVYYALKGAGVGVSRLSSAGYAGVSSWETITSKDDLKKGDLVFFRSDSSSSISHVGIYLGGGNFIHSAPSLSGVGYSTMSSGYYSRNFQTAKRVF